MNALILITALALAQVNKPVPPPQPGAAGPSSGVISQNTALDYMNAEQQKQWLLAHLMVDLHFNDKKIAEWEKKLSAMTPTMIGVTAKAYVLEQEKKKLQDDRNFAMRMAKMQMQANTYWYRTYYKSYSYSNYSYPCYPSWGYGGYGGLGYGGAFTIPVVIRRR